MEDFIITANHIKGLIRSWRAKGINPGDTMKLMLLYLGVDRYLDPKTMVYPRKAFNRIRKENGYRSTSAMLDVIRRSESFLIVYSQKTDDIVAIVSPAIKYKLVIEGDLCFWDVDEPIKVKEKRVANRDTSIVAGGDSPYLNKSSEDAKQASSRLTINTAEAEKSESNQSNGHLEVPMPELNKKLFHDKPSQRATEAVNLYFYYLFYEPDRMDELLGGFFKLLKYECHNDERLAGKVMEDYLYERVLPIFSRRKGIEFWTESQIDGWMRSLHQPRLVRYKVGEAMRNWQYRQVNKESV